jgi:hypothetical protein
LIHFGDDLHSIWSDTSVILRSGGLMVQSEVGGSRILQPGVALAWSAAVELLAAIGLLMFGAWRMAIAAGTDAWSGLALIGLALLFLLVRGSLQSRAQAALDAAAAAQRDARISRLVVTQYLALPRQADASAEELEADRERKNPWTHSTLRRGGSVPGDPQKNQWGGKDARNGRRLSAEVAQLDADWFSLVIKVESTDPAKPLLNRVRFHLHDSFPGGPVIVKPRGGVARLDRIASGAFTVGAEVDNEPDTFLELDLGAPEVGAPPAFRNR